LYISFWFVFVLIFFSATFVWWVRLPPILNHDPANLGGIRIRSVPVLGGKKPPLYDAFASLERDQNLTLCLFHFPFRFCGFGCAGAGKGITL